MLGTILTSDWLITAAKKNWIILKLIWTTISSVSKHLAILHLSSKALKMLLVKNRSFEEFSAKEGMLKKRLGNTRRCWALCFGKERSACCFYLWNAMNIGELCDENNRTPYISRTNACSRVNATKKWAKKVCRHIIDILLCFFVFFKKIHNTFIFLVKNIFYAIIL